MQKLLITGASGFLGWNIARYIEKHHKDDWQIIGSYQHNPVNLTNVEAIQIDLTNTTALNTVFSQHKPDAVIHAAAASKPAFCEEHPQIAYAINVFSSLKIAALCKKASIPLIFTSTDLVFDGTSAPYKETDPTSAVSVYGKQKVEAEKGILELYSDALICRMPLMFGDAPAHANLFFSFVLNSLKAGKELKLFCDDIRVPVSGQVASQGLLHVLGKASGLLHMGGDEQVTRYDFGLKIVEAFGFQNADIKPISMDDVDFLAHPSKDVAMDCGKARALGFHPPSLATQLNSLKYLVSN